MKKILLTNKAEKICKKHKKYEKYYFLQKICKKHKKTVKTHFFIKKRTLYN